MFLNVWSIALCLISLLVFFLLFLAARTGYRVLRFWNPDSDQGLQIRLENETWLASTLVAYALGFQLISLVVFVLAADNFCQVIAGAMCATGSLMVNDFGLPALGLKIAGVFLYGFWLVLHQLDVSCETYPLVRLKYGYLLGLLPFLGADIFCQTAYIAALEPDIITSCCAVVFSGAKNVGSNLLIGIPKNTLLVFFYGTAVFLFFFGLFYARRLKSWTAWVWGTGWAWFFFVAMLGITTVFSSYVYGMPYHKCPFCILKPEYYYFGFLLYGTLLPAVFFGLSGALVSFMKNRTGLEHIVDLFQRRSMRISIILLLIFVILTSYHLLVYTIFGGQV